MVRGSKKQSKWQKIRKLLNDLHLWMGLTAGLVLFVVCLTGTIYTFAPEIQEYLEPGLYNVDEAPAKRLLPEELIKKVEQTTGANAVLISLPDNPHKMVSVAVRKKGEKGRPTTYQVNPYIGEVAGIYGKGKGAEFFFTIFKLHRWLLLDATIGRPIVGVATILFALGCITGIVIWFPQKVKYWKQGLKLKFSGNWKRINHDLHNSLGFYSFIFLLIMALTGLCWSFSWHRDSISAAIGAKVFDRSQLEAVFSNVTDDNAVPLALNRQINEADAYFDFQGTWHVSLPKGKKDALQISKSKTGFFAPSYGDYLFLDNYSGAVLRFDRFSDKSFGEKVATSIKALHIGTIYGTASKILYFICCLIATSLPVTGTLIWWNKLKQKKKRSGKNALKRKVRSKNVSASAVS